MNRSPISCFSLSWVGEESPEQQNDLLSLHKKGMRCTTARALAALVLVSAAALVCGREFNVGEAWPKGSENDVQVRPVRIQLRIPFFVLLYFSFFFQKCTETLSSNNCPSFIRQGLGPARDYVREGSAPYNRMVQVSATSKLAFASGASNRMTNRMQQRLLNLVRKSKAAGVEGGEEKKEPDWVICTPPHL